MGASVMTVRGPIEPDALGYTLTHEHLLCDITRPYWTAGEKTRLGSDFYFEDEEVVLEDEAVAIEELLYYKRAGGGSLVEVTPICLHRDPEGLRRISEATDIHVVMGTAFYFELHYPARVHNTSTNKLAAEFERDLTIGVDDTGIRAGIIGEIGTNRDYISPAEERVYRAASRAHLRTGAAITTHAVHGRIGLAQLDLLQEEGVDLRRVIIGHCDLHRHPDYHEAIARRGAVIEFDLINSWSAPSHPRLVQIILELIDRGYLSQIVLSQDICVRPYMRTHGGGGYAYLLTNFVPMLREGGLSNEQLDILLRENPKRLLAF
jgi:phosphotriesterase-related protein